MTMDNTDKLFAGSIPELYDTYLVPLIFEPYAADLARRVAAVRPRRVLEIAAGTGVATRAMSLALPADVSLVATDLNQPMLDRAAAVGTARPVTWRQADALRTYRRVHAVFIGEFGIEPGHELRRLEAAVLAGSETGARPMVQLSRNRA